MSSAYMRTSAPDTEHALDRRQPSPVAADFSSEDHYFHNSTPPNYLEDLEAQVREFVQLHRNRRIAVITSGGTTVPLENNTVRFIDNFSAGTRGSASAEQFIEAGYAVVFLHREFSLQPYSRHYSHSTNCFLDFLEPQGNQVVVKKSFEGMRSVLDKYMHAKSEKLLLMLPFTTVNQYLYSLRSIATIVAPVAGQNALFYLAAAVSDFFLPQSRISEHKIQSNGKSTLSIELDPVPKFLRRLTEQWTPNAFVVSFKLETDKSILLYKCRQALVRYGHQLVIGNLLQTRKSEVVFVATEPSKEPTVTDESAFSSTWVTTDPDPDSDSAEIESIFVPKVIDMHASFFKLEN